eukprot:GABU01005814.1.p2 GENE.GABU01005814.1~~GABU01005814.1.p2  ORF type:complete len:105 (+),score=3.96 GABU01005814.1:54-368(+)
MCRASSPYVGVLRRRFFFFIAELVCVLTESSSFNSILGSWKFSVLRGAIESLSRACTSSDLVRSNSSFITLSSLVFSRSWFNSSFRSSLSPLILSNSFVISTTF